MKYFYYTFIISVANLSMVNLASAAPTGITPLNNPAPGGGATLKDFIDLLISIIQLVLTPVLVVCIIYAGYLFVSAKGNEEQISKAKLWLFSTLIGSAIVLAAQVIANIVYGTAGIF